MQLKRIVEGIGAEAPYYDLGKDFFSFTHAMNSATEVVKNKFEQAIAAKIKGKKIRARASRGYKQFEKDYDINVVNVSIDDYYDNYVVVVSNSKGKEFFLKPGFKVQIIGPAEAEKPDPKKQFPPKPGTPPAPPIPAPQPPPQAAPAQPAPQVKEETENSGGSELVRPYPIESIEKDLNHWLKPMIAAINPNFKQYIPREGVSKTKGRKTTVSYGIVIPVEDVPALNAEQVREHLSSASKIASGVGNYGNIYTLDKFDVRGGKYVIIIRKVLNY